MYNDKLLTIKCQICYLDSFQQITIQIYQL